MQKNLVQLYAVAICFVATLVLMCSLVSFYNDITDIVITEYKYDFSQFSSNRKYIDHKIANQNPSTESWIHGPESLITQKRIAERKEYIMTKQNNATRGLIKDFGWLMMSIISLAVHRKIYMHNNNLNST